MDESLVESDMRFRQTNLLQYIKLYLYGVHKNEARNGIKLDLIGENNAMQQYYSGSTPSIYRYLSNNVFFSDMDVLSYKSFAKAIFWSRCGNKDDALIEEDASIGASCVFHFSCTYTYFYG